MITVSKTPVRISFFGGGTDYPAYLESNKGAVLGCTINKYIYTVALPMAGFAENRFRVTYRNVEHVDTIDEISHPVVRAGLKEMGYDHPLNVAIISDMPGGTGLGSSSAFTVGFVNLIQHLKGSPLSRYDLAQRAIHIEHDILHENVGVQDQVHAAFGGLSHYIFHKREILIRPINIKTDCRRYLNDSLMLVHTGTERHASEAVSEQIENTKAKKITTELSHLVKLAEQGVAVFEQESPDAMLADLGQMLNEAWLTKRKLSSSISNNRIDEIYQRGMEIGAVGGKLCGAGQGGFFLFLVPPEKQKQMAEVFGSKRIVKVEIEDCGSVVTGRRGLNEE